MRDNPTGKEEIKGSKLLQLIIYLLFGLGPLTGNVILVLFAVLSGEFGVPQSAVAAAISAFMFPFAIIQLFSGAISDTIGRAKVILIGLVIFAGGMIIAATSINLAMYIIANVIAGFGFGLVNPSLIALMSDITPGPRMPMKMGFLGAVASLGVAFGPILAGLLVSAGWRYLYIIFIVIIGMCFILFLIIKPPEKTSKSETSALKTLFTHFSQEIKRLSVILMILSAFFVSMTYLAITIWTSRAFAGHLEESLTGIIIGIAGLMAVISSTVSGILIQKIGVKVSLLLGFIPLFLGILILILIPDVTSITDLWVVLIALSLSGIGGGSLFPGVLFYSQSLSKDHRGALAGLATAGQFIGVAIVPIVYQPIFMFGGISAIYITILIIFFVLVLVFTGLYLKARK